MAQDQWYYLANGQTFGPMTGQQLRQYAAAGYFRPSDYVWQEGMPNWVVAGQVPGVLPPAGGKGVMPPFPPGTPQTLDYAASQAGSPGYLGYSGFWRRVAASLIDGIVVLLGSVVLGIVLGVLLAAGGGRNKEVAQMFGNLLGVVTGWLYAALMESSEYQGTVGKMALGIKVTDMYGRRISFGRATGRHFAKILSSLTVFVGYIMVVFTERKQGLHDMIAGCLVPKAR
jgi:uncharacterized RDD family membrane protein YckC